MELKLARCEALFSHGHTATATAKAAELITHMRGCLPSVVWRYDEVTEGMIKECERINALKILTTNGDSSISNSFPITSSNKKVSTSHSSSLLFFPNVWMILIDFFSRVGIHTIIVWEDHTLLNTSIRLLITHHMAERVGVNMRGTLFPMGSIILLLILPFSPQWLVYHITWLQLISLYIFFKINKKTRMSIYLSISATQFLHRNYRMIKSIPYLRRLATLSSGLSSSLSMLIRGIVYEDESIDYRQISSYASHRHSVFRLLIDVLKMPKGAMSTNQLQVRTLFKKLNEKCVHH